MAQLVEERMVRTDQMMYDVNETPSPSIVLTVEIKNISRHEIFFPTRGRALLALERHLKDEWIVAFHAVHSLELTTPTTLAPGASIRDTTVLMLRGGVDPSPHLAEIAGSYRAVYAIFTSWHPNAQKGAPGELVDKEQRTSNEFFIR